MNKKSGLIFVTSVGGSLEFFDFMIFIYLYPVITKLFLPKEFSESFPTLVSISLVITSYFAKPLGGIIYGLIGEKFNLERTFQSTLLLSAISTTFISILPTYDSIGILAPVGLILMRIIQGISSGGDIPTSILYVFQNSDNKRFYLSLLFFGFTVGSFLALLLSSTLSLFFININESYSFRFLFAIGGILSILSFIIRKKFIKDKLNKKIIHIKNEDIDTNKYQTIKLTLLYGYGAALMSCFFVLIPNMYLNRFDNFSFQGKIILAVSILMSSIFGIIQSKVFKKYDTKFIYKIGVKTTILYAPVYFYLINKENYTLFVINQIIVSILCSPIFGNIYYIVCNKLNANYKLFNLGIICNIATTISPIISSSFVLSFINAKNNYIYQPIFIISYGILALLLINNIELKEVKYDVLCPRI